MSNTQHVAHDAEPNNYQQPAEPQVDYDQLDRFDLLIFQHCRGDNDAGAVAMVGYSHGQDGKRVTTTWPKHVEATVPAAYKTARRVGDMRGPSAVFCPPLVTFGPLLNKHGRRWLGMKNVLEAPVASVECDEGFRAAVETLRPILGPPTCTVLSGGMADGPNGPEPKGHIHYRLKRPAQTPEEIERLTELRRLMADVVGADLSGAPVVHPYRWPGSLHTKDPDNIRLARLGEVNLDAEIDQDEALAKVKAYMTEHGIEPRAVSRGRLRVRKPNKDRRPMTRDQLLACAEAIPNNDETWERWNRVGMVFWAASGGSEDGREAFELWSAKSQKDGAKDTASDRWDHLTMYPPEDLSAGTLRFMARQADPNFRLPFINEAEAVAALAQVLRGYHV